MKSTEIEVKEVDPLSLVDGDVIYCAWDEDDRGVTSWLAAVKHVDEEFPEYMELYVTLMLTTNGVADGEIEYNTDQDIGLDIIRYATEEEVNYFMEKLEEDNKERDDARDVLFDRQRYFWITGGVNEGDFLAF